MKKQVKPTVLVILDGFGHSEPGPHNAVSRAKTPNFDRWWTLFPHALLRASGKAVGLLEADIGNSEVGHLTLGAGRAVQQPVSIIHENIESKSFFRNPSLKSSLRALKGSGGRLHLMGLLSDASVHSHIKHLEAFLKSAQQHDIKDVYIHAFLDGRDVPPQSAKKYLDELQNIIKKIGIGKIASLHGRFYAMDRDGNWERTEKSYRTLTEKQNIIAHDWHTVLEKNYQDNITDEFIPPTQLNQNGVVKDGDGIIFFNFRPDRARQLTQAFIDPKFNIFPTKKINLTFFITPTRYASELDTTVLFEQPNINNALPEILHEHGKTFFAIAETEKYAHVTYFFSGGREKKLPTETRVLIPSIPAKNYVNNPEMSAEKITATVLESLQKDPHDFYLVNYANADMVGHSGNMDATVKAIEFLDGELKKLYEQIIDAMDGTLYITADHGNAEIMFDEKTGQPQTAHTTNPVPFLMIRKKLEGTDKTLELSQLADVAPFILKNMGITVPQEMLA